MDKPISAKINRSTFYDHYVDKFDLLDKVEEELFDNFKDFSRRMPANASTFHNLNDEEFIQIALTIPHVLRDQLLSR